jgi:hypothetical protein
MTIEDSREDRHYRAVIDQLVRSCRQGQGRIGSDRVLAGVWNENATDDLLPEQQEINLLLARMPKTDRKIVARMIREAFEGGVHETLVILHEEQVPPFDKGYEGTPFHDFVGRLAGWKWPKKRHRFY